MSSAFGDYVRAIRELHGAEGARWLNQLSTLIRHCEQRWSLTVGPPFALLYNCVEPAVRVDGTEVVLKLGVPHPEFLAEEER